MAGVVELPSWLNQKLESLIRFGFKLIKKHRTVYRMRETYNKQTLYVLSCYRPNYSELDPVQFFRSLRARFHPDIYVYTSQ